MRRILITDEIRNVAIRYSNELQKKVGGYKIPKDSLTNFYNHLAGLKSSKIKKLAEYVKNVKDNLDAIILLEPSNFDSWYSKLNQWGDEDQYKKSMKVIIDYKGHEKEFYKHILDAMRYDRVQEYIMPKYIEELGIKTCVYCNSQYAITTDDISGRRYAHYELDHFKPKSQYPFLCVSFFNLQPSCSNCNKHKSNEESLFRLYTEKVTEQEAFTLRLNPASVICYESSFNHNDLDIVLDSSDKVLLENHEKRFHISKVYPRFKKEAAEILWHKKAYNPAYMAQVAEGFVDVFPTGVPDIETLYWGHDMEPDAVHKRPLNKLAQDLRNTL